MQHVSAWRQAGSHLIDHWRGWLVFLLATFAFGWLIELLVRPLLPSPAPVVPLGPQAALASSVAVLAAVATIAPLYVAVGSFMAAAEFSLFRAAADAGAAPTFASYFRGGWDFWSWTWRGIGFACVLGLALYLASAVLGFAGALIPFVGFLIVIALVLAWVLVVVPVAAWGWIAGFYFRPTPYWASLRRAWDAFRAHPGPMLGPIYAMVGVSIVVLGPAFVSSYFSMQSAVLHPGTPPLTAPAVFSPILILPSLILGAFELWALLTIMIRIKEWEAGASVPETPASDAR